MTLRIERLERLDELRRMGAITDAEFEAQKAKLLGSLTQAHAKDAEDVSLDRVNSYDAYETPAENSDNLIDQHTLASSKKLVLVVCLSLAVLFSGYFLTSRTPSSGLLSGQGATALSSHLPEIGLQPVAFVEGDPDSTAARVVAALFSQGAKCYATISMGATTDIYEIDASEGTVLAQANGLWPDRLFDFKLVADHLELKPRAKYDSDIELVKFKSIRRDGEAYKISSIVENSYVSDTVFSCRSY